MDTGGFDVDAVRQALQRIGLTGLLAEDQAATLAAALSALGEHLSKVEQLQAPEVLAETLQVWAERLVQIFDDLDFSGEIIGSPVAFALAWAWWVTVNRQAKAILRIYDAGLGVDTAPMMRSMIEHCLWLVVFARDDSPLLATILRETDEQRKKMIKDAVGGLLELPPEIAVLVTDGPAVPGEGSHTKSFLAVCRTLGVSETVGVIWRMLSSLSHPTSTTAYFLTQIGTAGVALTKTPALPGIDPAGLAYQAVSLVVNCTLWAGFAIDRLMADHPLHPLLQTIGDEAQVKELGGEDSGSAA